MMSRSLRPAVDQRTSWTSLVAHLCLLSLCFQSSFGLPGPINEDPRYSFIHNATNSPLNDDSYDYIVVGGGTAGCPLAATLSEKFKVLLLERGGQPYHDPTVLHLEQYNTIQAQSNVNGTTAGQRFVSEDGVPNLRANILGGGSAVNAGFFTYASEAYQRRLGWDRELVAESYDWVARVVARFPVVRDWQNAFRRGLLQAGVLPDNGRTYEHLGGTKIGGTTFDHSGYRHTAADLLQYADPERLTVYTWAMVERILIDRGAHGKKRAYGVMYTDSHGVQHTATLRKDAVGGDIILSAGALGSPQLLMLSGIGPESKLEPHGIEVKVPLEGVGEGMADNPTNAIYAPSPRPVENSLIQVVGVTPNGSFIEGASGNVLLFGTRPQSRSLSVFGNFGAFLQKVSGPLSTGRLWLRSTYARDNPIVRFNYYAEPADLQACIQGIHVIDKVLRSDAFEDFRFSIPSDILGSSFVLGALPDEYMNDTERLGRWCKNTVVTIWHYHGGCRVGSVVHQKTLRVLGLDALRVIDGSTWNFTPGTNPQATVMMLGRYMGVQILRDRLSD